MRAFLQRADVRLSTVHRVATALLSGAGILVLLPAVERDTLVQVVRSLLIGGPGASGVALTASIVLAVALPLSALWLLLFELTRFYFHANHVRGADGGVFTPRFTLTGLRLPSDELGAATSEHLAAARRAEENVELLVPSNSRARARIDRQLQAYPGLAGEITETGDAGRAERLFRLAASTSRPLAEEVAKVEFGMARHMLRMQVIVLRYVKTLLAMITTAIAAFSAAAAMDPGLPASVPAQRWVAGIMLVWAPVVVLVVSAPVRWLERLLRAEGAGHAALRSDPELTAAEQVAAALALAAWIAAVIASVVLLGGDATPTGRTALAVVLVGSTLLQARVTWKHTAPLLRALVQRR